MTSEQLEAARAERMRQNGPGPLTLEDARTWIEETGLCLFLPRRQFSSSVTPTFVEAVVGKRDETPDPRQIATAEELLVRLELKDVTVRLNLLGLPIEQPDFVVASWVLPYVYALRGDRDWRRIPQLTGSRAVSPLAVQAYKLLEQGDLTIAQLKQGLGREVSESAVVRAITELWQQLRIVPVITAPGQPAKWQLLRQRFQKAIAEGASTSQVTAISVLASIYLQAVIAAPMEDVEIFLSPLTARSKVREVLRGLVATRQVHTLALGHAPHFYVAGTLPEFQTANPYYVGAAEPTSSFYLSSFERAEYAYQPAPVREVTPVTSLLPPSPMAPKPAPVEPPVSKVEAPRPQLQVEMHAPRTPARKPAAAIKPAAARPHSRPAPRKPGIATSHSTSQTRPGTASRWSKSAGSKSGGNRAVKAGSNGFRGKSVAKSAGNARNTKSTTPMWAKSSGHAQNGKLASKATVHKTALAHKDVRGNARGNRKPVLAAGVKAGGSKRYGFTVRSKQESKKRG